ncbi:MAG: RluA family pseudouridine synthase [Planctomycetota bacterium]
MRNAMMVQSELDGAEDGPRVLSVEADRAGQRLDVFVNELAGWHSRGRIKDQIKLGGITVNGKVTKPSHRVREGDLVQICAEPNPDDSELIPENIPLEIIFEDTSIAVLNKAPFIVVHPGAGHQTGTLANALAHHLKELSDVSGPQRPGIVHRLDRDTSGVMCVAKTNRAHYAITTQFQERTVEKTYYALVDGVMEFDEYKVDEPIGRHPAQPTKMAITPKGRQAFTKFMVLERFDGFTYVRCHPRTGRTHQIRVHLAHLGHPVICDKQYGRRQRMDYGDVAHLAPGHPENRKLLARQALHAATLTLNHPLKGERMTFEAPLTDDFQSVLDALRETRRARP